MKQKECKECKYYNKGICENEKNDIIIVRQRRESKEHQNIKEIEKCLIKQ